MADAWKQAADPALLDRLERWSSVSHPFEMTIRPALREPRLLLERTDWRERTRCDFEIGERELPHELGVDQQERCPQAKLRDLFRPVMEIGWHQRDQLVEPTDVGGLAAVAEARAAAQMPRRVPPFEALAKVVRQEQDRRRAWLAERWPTHLPDDAPRVYTPWGTGFGAIE